MFVNLPDEIIYRIVNKLDSMEIYYLTLTSKHLNKMNFQAILTALLFKTHFDLDRNDLIEYKKYGYTLSNYLSDLSEINSYNMFNYEKKNLMNIKIHSIYRIPFIAYRLLKMQKSSILALIY
jgi:hypothetical protein